MGGSSFRIDRGPALRLRSLGLAELRAARALALWLEAHGSVDETLCMPAKAFIIVRTLVRTPATKGSCYAMIGCRHAKAFIIVKTLVCTSAIKGFYYDENDCRHAMNLDTAAIDRCTAAIIDVHASIDVRRPVEKHCRLAMKHCRPHEAFDTLLIDLMRPATAFSPSARRCPGPRRPPQMQSGALRRRPCCPACPLAGAGACYMLRRYWPPTS